MADNIDILVIDEKDISDDLDIAIRDGLVECFPLDVEYFSKQSWWHTRPQWRTLAQDDKGQVVGHIAIVIRDVLVGDNAEPVKVAGIQSVFVRPRMQGTVVADKIMEMSMLRAGQQGLDAGFLFCIPELEKVYCRMEWQKIDADVIMQYNKGNTVPIPGKNITMIYPLKRKDFPAGDVNLTGRDW